jgi:hypothetical protein
MQIHNGLKQPNPQFLVGAALTVLMLTPSTGLGEICGQAILKPAISCSGIGAMTTLQQITLQFRPMGVRREQTERAQAIGRIRITGMAHCWKL